MSKRIIRLTEADLENIVRKVLSEQGWEERGKPVEQKNKQFNLGNFFESGQYKLNNSVKLQNAIKEIKKFISNYDQNKVKLDIVAGESKVPNPKGFEEVGSLAMARANEIKKYLENELGIKINTIDTKIGDTPWEPKKGKDHEDYKQEQFVNLNIDLSGVPTRPRVFVAPKPIHGINASGSVRVYGFLDGTKYVLRYKYPEEFKYLKLINKSNDYQEWSQKRHRLNQVCNRYGSLCKSVEYPVGQRILVDNDETFNQLIQKMKDEKLRFPVGVNGKEINSI